MLTSASKIAFVRTTFPQPVRRHQEDLREVVPFSYDKSIPDIFLIGLVALVKLAAHLGRQSPSLKRHMLRFAAVRKTTSTAIADHARRG
jgi:hypothetical protein